VTSPGGATRLREVTSHEELLAATGESGFVRHDIPDPLEGTAHVLGAAVAFPRRTHTRRLGLLVMGPPDDAARLLDTLLEDDVLPDGLTSVTVERGSFEAVSTRLPLGEGNDWEWMCTTAPPPQVPAESRLEELAPNDEPAIRTLLSAANPNTDARPFEHPGQRWVGVRAADGLVACGVREPGVAGTPVLAGITVAARARGTGLGLAVTARLTREAVAESGVCTLGMYSHNSVARRVYLGLGYGDVHEWSSRRLVRPAGA
jgi:GNAT superfamily N-acetyltransferase